MFRPDRPGKSCWSSLARCSQTKWNSILSLNEFWARLRPSCQNPTQCSHVGFSTSGFAVIIRLHKLCSTRYLGEHFTYCPRRHLYSLHFILQSVEMESQQTHSVSRFHWGLISVVKAFRAHTATPPRNHRRDCSLWFANHCASVDHSRQTLNSGSGGGCCCDRICCAFKKIRDRESRSLWCARNSRSVLETRAIRAQCRGLRAWLSDPVIMIPPTGLFISSSNVNSVF
jgi:hypothetical protein